MGKMQRSFGWLWLLLFGFVPGIEASGLERIRPSADGSHFIFEGTARRVVLWGFNYDRDDSGRLLEDYWADEWATVAEDFREMKALGANVVRVHLQLGRFMTDAGRPDDANLARLGRLVGLAETAGLYLDVTGLGCYHRQDVPAWYDALPEGDRWDVQARFWEAVARACRESAAIFCFDLMNEPILTGGEPKDTWLPGEPLGGKYFVQRITRDMKGRSDREVARAWVEKLTGAIRKVDPGTMITVGVIPWSQVFPGAKPLFYAPDVGRTLDFTSIHFYPRAGKLDADLAALQVYDVGKPLVVEEFFPLSASFDEAERFMERAKPMVDGWISFYWGKTIAEYEKKGDRTGAMVAGWLGRFRGLSPFTVREVPGEKPR